MKEIIFNHAFHRFFSVPFFVMMKVQTYFSSFPLAFMLLLPRSYIPDFIFTSLKPSIPFKTKTGHSRLPPVANHPVFASPRQSRHLPAIAFRQERPPWPWPRSRTRPFPPRRRRCGCANAPLPADNIPFACGQKKGATRRPLPSLR